MQHVATYRIRAIEDSPRGWCRRVRSGIAARRYRRRVGTWRVRRESRSWSCLRDSCGLRCGSNDGIIPLDLANKKTADFANFTDKMANCAPEMAFCTFPHEGFTR